ncbi:hypothetical protein [Pseudomonas grimontii]|uniref:hypothetical protein n=1 Tax=Pseudomonas grimontii TaxID=129847 RepID=UPI00387B2945
MTLRTIDEAAQDLATGFRALRQQGFKVVRSDERSMNPAELLSDARLAASSLLGVVGPQAHLSKHSVDLVARSISQNIERPAETVHCVLLGGGEPKSITDDIAKLNGRILHTLTEYERAQLSLWQKVGRKFSVDVTLSSSEETDSPLVDVDEYVAREYRYAEAPGTVQSEVTQAILKRANSVIVVKLGFATTADEPAS